MWIDPSKCSCTMTLLLAGGIAQAYYKKISDYIVTKVRQILDEDLLAIVGEFNKRYGL